MNEDISSEIVEIHPDEFSRSRPVGALEVPDLVKNSLLRRFEIKITHDGNYYAELKVNDDYYSEHYLLGNDGKIFGFFSEECPPDFL